jgi:peptidoglycan endopeptidase LytE
LKVGQKIQIPAGGSGSGSSSAPGTAMGAASDSGSENIVTVKPGDSLAKIAHEHGSTIKLIRSANDLKTDKIKVGQKLKVPAKASSAPAAATPAPEPMPAPAPATVSPPMPPPSVPANGGAR